MAQTGAFCVGIAGVSGSGKTSTADAIAAHFPDALVISYDRVYKPLSAAERVDANFDDPSALDHALMADILRDLTSGTPVYLPVYEYGECTSTRSETVTYPRSMIIVEGIHAFHDKTVRDYYDYTVFVECDEKVARDRRFTRDERVRGISREENEVQYVAQVKPAQDKWVLPSRKFADSVVVNTCDRICSSSAEGFDRVVNDIKRCIDRC